MRVVSRFVTSSLLVFSLVAVCGAALSAQGQSSSSNSRNPNLISARAGGINYVSGDVTVRRQGEATSQAVTIKDELATGDVLQTGAGSRAEVLLNPGSYIRLGENTVFTLADDSLESLRVKLLKGSALVEAAGAYERSITITVETPQTEALIIKSGIYRFSVLPDSSVTEISVREGRALVGREQTLLRGGKRARVDGSGGMEVAQFDRKQKDEFDLWSRERAKMLAEANRKLSHNEVNTVLATSMMFDNLWTRGLGISGGRDLYVAGVWYFDPGRSCFTFIPGSYGWTSPYGSGYNNSFYWREPNPLCVNCRNPTLNDLVTLSGPGANGSNAGAGTNTGSGTGSSARPAPAPSARPEPSAPREFVRPSFEAPRSVERAQPAMPTRNQ
jgi:hypothetical protein